MKIFDKFIDRFRRVLIPFILIWVIVGMVGGGIFQMILSFIKKHSAEILIVVGTFVFVVPITIAIATDWEIPEILIAYDLLFGMVVLLMLAGSVDSKYYEEQNGYNDCRGYQSSNYNRTYGYNNTYWNPTNREKERNGGFTDKEVTLKKQMIRRKLEKNNLLDRTINEKEEVTTNE